MLFKSNQKMKEQILIVLAALLSIGTYAQINFQKGYIFKNNSERIEVLIKNEDWRNSPSHFQYKLSEESKIQTGTLKSIKGFGVEGEFDYKKITVNIDRSKREIGELGMERRPHFKREELFLKTLVEGEANLYLYRDGNLRRFFYSVNDSPVEQLIYKKYKISAYKVATNNRYQQQLKNNVFCQNLSDNAFEEIDYSIKDLSKYFAAYNKCKNADYFAYSTKDKYDAFNLNIRLGLNNTSLSVHNNIADSRNADFGNQWNLRIGIEAEFVLPFNKNKWSITFEPTYQYFKAEAKTSSIYRRTAKIDYSSIEMPIGVRYYLFLNEDSQIFLNAAYLFDIDLNSKLIYEGQKNLVPIKDLEINPNGNMVVGVGYKYKKYSVEVRYGMERSLLTTYVFYSAKYPSLSFILGYTLF